MIKLFKRHWRNRVERFYSRNRWHLILDLCGLVIIVVLLVSLALLHFYRPNLSLLSWPSNKHQAIDLNNPPLDFNCSFLNSVVKPSEAILLKIKYKNSGATVINNVKLKILSKNQGFIISKIESADSNLGAELYKIKGSELIVNKIKSAEEGEINLKINFQYSNSEQKAIYLQLQSEYSLGGQPVKKIEDLPEIKLASELNVNSVVYYNSPQGDQLGIGPLPPVVGIPTNYWVFWEAKNNGDFKDFIMSARLPKNVELGAGRSLLAGDLKYNSASRQIIWTVPEIKTNNGTYRVGFEVQLIPTINDIDKILPLITNTNYYSVDAFSGIEVEGNTSDLTSNLDFDKINKGAGKVISQ